MKLLHPDIINGVAARGDIHLRTALDADEDGVLLSNVKESSKLYRKVRDWLKEVKKIQEARNK